ncbi:hypothetical protein SISSUDRAFT_1128116 [Sistotremastrum suecicum HHB10207 ss-3]|uniref:Zn(2)-C6 fungal-type domain-containing protein n=1 Tax=Sistotremastrum suecicum HHB10207 ss-3 TaxID=1314776 RepID=A0A166E7F2_9AGAM|nr:hypothetical protein SISSUDRAFT_1128116 [Sistotremastrum suecicum HHB10207 ss-3]
MDWQVHGSGQTILDADAMNAYLPEFSDVPTLFSSPLNDDQIFRAIQLFNERAEEEISPNRVEERRAAGIACDEIVIDPALLALDGVVDVQNIPSSRIGNSSAELKQPGGQQSKPNRPGFKDFKFYETPPTANKPNHEETTLSSTRDMIDSARRKQIDRDSPGKRTKACKQCRKIRRPCIYKGVPDDEHLIQCVRCHAKDLDCEISTRKVQFVGCRAHLLAEGKIWIYDKHMPEPS